ncbi:pyridoxamine 5'-phosphate oxidase family protein [Microbacterium profundi]|uniref:pyridoxamine 5'-phosphate oxidase family protein n=1 Tax=Microbacterium profundi TaxID=450380 RepID=UPI0019D167D3|nr:pyridoxamine 5'-phosphate oxidase family protein [Microbacterium profundi]MCE7481816.1 pyridoxamine 5'-phosphate oxidase family protein [Microbacterium profundi]
MNTPEPDSRRTDTGSDLPGTRVERLPTAECWRLMGRAGLGRLAVDGADGAPDVFPVNYLVHSGSVFFRTAPGSKLTDVTVHPAVALEVDGDSVASRWSVVIRGDTHRLDTEDAIEESGIRALVSFDPTSKQNFIRLTPGSITGRRFRRRLPDVRPHSTSPVGVMDQPGAQMQTETRSARVDGKPTPIPHFPPHREK